ncbi:MAG: hypothetical protein KAR42_05850 [candidate division Zixibacteria bacterium]|nr:hypothetical protein [candidate division Zixibacteria bacterium]
MKRLLFFASLALFIMTIPWLWGCSTTDDNPVNSSDSTGLTIASQDIIESTIGEGQFEMSFMQAMIALELADGILTNSGSSARFKPFGPESDDFSIIINSQVEEGNWFILTITATIIGENDEGGNDTIYFNGTDSLRFTDSSGFTMTPDSTITALDARTHHSARVLSSGDSLSAANHNVFDFTFAHTDTTWIGGTVFDTLALYITGDSADCVIEASNNQTWNDLLVTQAVMNEDECPPAGTITSASTLAINCVGEGPADSLSISGAWTVAAVFNDGLITINYTAGNTNWSVTDTCGTGGGADSTATFDSTFVDNFEDYIDDDMRSGLGNSFKASLELLSIFDTSLSLFGDTAMFNIDLDVVDWTFYPSGWLVFTLDMHDTSQYYIESVGGTDMVTQYEHVVALDSIRVYDNGIAQLIPNSNADSMQMRMHYTVDITNDLEETFAIKGDHRASTIGVPWNGSVFTVSGSGTDSTEGTLNRGIEGSTVCSLSVYSSSIVSNVVIDVSTMTDEDDGCPSSGALIVTANVSFSCASAGASYDFDGLWNISTTFNGTSNTTSYGHNGFNVTVYWQCGGSSSINDSFGNRMLF